MDRISTETRDELKGLIHDIVRRVVDHPDDVTVNVVPSAYRLLAELHTNQEDVGQVVGKNGHVITSIRSLVTAFGGKHRCRVELDFVTEQDQDARRSGGRGRRDEKVARSHG